MIARKSILICKLARHLQCSGVMMPEVRESDGSRRIEVLCKVQNGRSGTTWTMNSFLIWHWSGIKVQIGWAGPKELPKVWPRTGLSRTSASLGTNNNRRCRTIDYVTQWVLSTMARLIVSWPYKNHGYQDACLHLPLLSTRLQSTGWTPFFLSFLFIRLIIIKLNRRCSPLFYPLLSSQFYLECLDTPVRTSF